MSIKERRPTASRYPLVACAIVAAACIFLHLSLRDGHSWDGDFALYVMQAENIVTGHLYTDTNFIADPRNAVYPALYPPGLPWLLAPVYKLYGLDLERMKEVGVFSLLGFLLVFAYVARRFIEDVPALALTALLAIHPYLVWLKDTIFSELPFMLFVFGSLLLSDRLIRERVTTAQAPFAVFSLAVLVALSFLTRTVAVVMFPALLLAGWYGFRRIVNPVGIAVAVAAVLVALARIWFPSDSGTYVGYFAQLSVASLFESLRAYAAAMHALLHGQVLQPSFLQWLAIGCFIGIALVGFIDRVRRALSVYEIFSAGYLALLMIFPVHLEPERYSLPLWPLLLLYFVCGALSLARFIFGRTGKAWDGTAIQRHLPVAVVIAFALPWIHGLTKLDFRPIEYSVTDPLSMELFAAIKKLPPDAVLLTRKPTTFGLFGERKASVWPYLFSDEEFWQYARQIRAQYVIQEIGTPQSPGYFKTDQHLADFMGRHASSFHLVFSNAWWNLYRIDVPSSSPQQK